MIVVEAMAAVAGREPERLSAGERPPAEAAVRSAVLRNQAKNGPCTVLRQ